MKGNGMITKHAAARSRRAGFTLMEAVIAAFLVGVSAAVVFTELMISYRVLMHARGVMDAQGVAFDELWSVYHLDWETGLRTFNAALPTNAVYRQTPTPEHCIYSTNGFVRTFVIWTNSYSCDITVQVWPPEYLAIGTNPAAQYWIRRYDPDGMR